MLLLHPQHLSRFSILWRQLFAAKVVLPKLQSYLKQYLTVTIEARRVWYLAEEVEKFVAKLFRSDEVKRCSEENEHRRTEQR